MDWLPLLEKCAQRVREEALPFFSTPDANISFGRGAGGDTMKKIDLIAEKAIIETIEEDKASCTLISEETGIKKVGRPPHEYYLTTDPIDGTTNALRGIPFMATSLAISKAPSLQRVETAIVSDLCHDVTYAANRGQGAFRNGRKIEPSSTSSLEKAVVGLDLKGPRTTELMMRLQKVLDKTKHLRHLGANALEICYVADGSTDAFIDLRGKLRVTDVAAAYLILQEAGGIIVGPDGGEIEVALNATQRVSFLAVGNDRLYRIITQSIDAR